MIRTLFAVAVFIVIAMGCDVPAKPITPTNDDLLNAFLSAHSPYVHLQDLKGIVHVTESGCMACNRAFATLVGEHSKDSTLLFIVSAIGQQVDVTTFKEDTGHVIWDYDEELKKSGILDKSGFIKLRNGRIDTIVRLDPAHIESQLALIADWVSGRQ